MTENAAYHGALIRIVQDAVSVRLSATSGSYVLKLGPDALSAEIMRDMASALDRIGTVPSLSTLLFFVHSDDFESQKFATSIDYGRLAAAPWLVTDSTAFATLLENPGPNVKVLLSGFTYPSPTLHPLATSSQQLVLRRLHELKGSLDAPTIQQFHDVALARARILRQIDGYVFRSIAQNLHIAALQDAELPYEYNPDESAPLLSEQARLSGGARRRVSLHTQLLTITL
jgi:hypothetical protein